MTAIQLLACAGMIAGVFLMLGIRPVEFTDSLFGFFLNPRRSLREELKKSSGRKKEGILRREMKEAQAVLQMTGRGSRFSMVCAAALALFCMGGSIAILLGNFFLAPVMAVGFLFLPFWYVKLTANHYKRDVSAELETALSVITTAYLRTEDIVAKLSDMRNVNAELEYMIAEPRKEFMLMVVFVIGNIPLMYLLNQDWYDVLMHTALGQCILAVTAAAIFISAGFVVKLTQIGRASCRERV